IERKRGALIAANKWDLIGEKEEGTARAYERDLRRILRRFDYVPVIFISALRKQRTGKAIDLAREVHAERRKRITTNQLNETLLPEIAASPPSSNSGREIKLKYVTQVKSSPPVMTFFANEPDLIPDQYRRFLEKKIRGHFGFTGVPLTISFRKKT